MRRHPAVDPQPGDRLQRGDVVRRVTGRGLGGSVMFRWSRHDLPGREVSAQQRLGCWTRWATGATLLAAPGWPPS